MRFAWPSAERGTCTRRTLAMSCDAYVSLRLNDPLSLTHRTQTVLKTTHPVFNEIFAFEWHGQDQSRT